MIGIITILQKFFLLTNRITKIGLAISCNTGSYYKGQNENSKSVEIGKAVKMQ